MILMELLRMDTELNVPIPAIPYMFAILLAVYLVISL